MQENNINRLNNKNSKSRNTQIPLKIGTFNILSDGLCLGEFLSEGGNSVSAGWNVREEKIHNLLINMFENTDIIVTQENDHFFSILETLQNKNPNIKGIFSIKGNLTTPSNSRYIAIGRLYKSYADATHKENINTSVRPKDPKYDLKYDILNDLLKEEYSDFPKEFTFKSFIEESPKFCNISSTLYKKFEEDLYIQDDGIGIYYDSSKVNLISINAPILYEDSNMVITLNKDGYVICNFEKNVKQFSLCGAHLPSGEDAKGEFERVTILSKIFEQIQDIPMPIIAMDSNNSLLYERSINKGPINKNKILEKYISELIDENGFIDIGRNTVGYECYKMRHAMGDQPKKFCEFMFDTIDKIVVRSGVKAEICNRDELSAIFNFYPIVYYPILMMIRENPEIRELFKKLCERTGKTNKLVLNKNGKEKEESLKNSSNLAQQIFASNSTKAYNRRTNESYLKQKDDLLEKIGNGLTSMEFIKYLYPNKGSPSDHPPLCAIIYL